MHALEAANVVRRLLDGDDVTAAELAEFDAFLAVDAALVHDVAHVEAHGRGLACPCAAAGHGCHFAAQEATT